MSALTHDALREGLRAMPLHERLALIAPIYREDRRANQHRVTWLYAFQAGADGPIKIGISDNPKQRLETLQRCCPYVLRPRACWRGLPEEEKLIHAEYGHVRLRGKWFEPAADLLSHIDSEGDDFGGFT